MKKKRPYLCSTLYLYDKDKKSDNLDYREAIDLIVNKKLIWNDNIYGDRIAIYIGNYYEVYDQENGIMKHIDAMGLLNYNTKKPYIEHKKESESYSFCNII